MTRTGEGSVAFYLSYLVSTTNQKLVSICYYGTYLLKIENKLVFSRFKKAANTKVDS